MDKNHKQIAIVAMLLFLIFDILTSSYHYYHLSIDGDITKISAPILWYQDVLNDPFGINALIHNRDYSGAGRYMAHESALIWFNYVFQAIHFFVKDSIVSLYLCSSLFTTLLHLSIIWMVYLYTKVRNKISTITMMFMFCLTSVFIQYNQLYDSIGLIDRSISYAFFYALPLILLSVYYYNFYKMYQTERNGIGIVTHIGLILLAPYLAFHGPLIQPIVFIITLLAMFGFIFIDSKKLKSFLLNKQVLAHATYFLLLCIYAFIISKHNNEKNLDKGLIERYVLLAKGIYFIVTNSIAIVCIVAVLSLNLVLIKSYGTETVKKTVYNQFFIMLAFSCIYISLLPLGGYRVYRPYILRYDTLSPITFVIVYVFVSSSIAVFPQLKKQSIKKFHALFLIGFMLLFTIKDLNLERNQNACQHRSFYQLYKSSDTILHVSRECNLGTWQISDLDDQYIQEMTTTLYRKWGIIKPYQVLK